MKASSISVVRTLFSQSNRRLKMSNAFTVPACRVDCNQASSLVRAGHTYLDVRTADEFAAGHIDGAPVVNLPVWHRNGQGGFEPNDAFVNEVELVGN